MAWSNRRKDIATAITVATIVSVSITNMSTIVATSLPAMAPLRTLPSKKEIPWPAPAKFPARLAPADNSVDNTVQRAGYKQGLDREMEPLGLDREMEPLGLDREMEPLGWIGRWSHLGWIGRWSHWGWIG